MNSNRSQFVKGSYIPSNKGITFNGRQDHILPVADLELRSVCLSQIIWFGCCREMNCKVSELVSATRTLLGHTSKVQVPLTSSFPY
jgi:hypothetical protein